MEAMTVKLFKNGQSQAVRIPKPFQFIGTDEVTVRHRGAVLITNNTRHFSKVPDLKFENWVS